MLYAALPVAYTALIFVKGSAPADPSSLQVNDKLAHAVVFFGLALCCAPAVGHASLLGRLGRKSAASLCALYSMLIGAALEFWQATIPHRTADVWDWVADAVGALTAAALLLALLPRYTAWRSRGLV